MLIRHDAQGCPKLQDEASTPSLSLIMHGRDQPAFPKRSLIRLSCFISVNTRAKQMECTNQRGKCSMYDAVTQTMHV